MLILHYPKLRIGKCVIDKDINPSGDFTDDFSVARKGYSLSAFQADHYGFYQGFIYQRIGIPVEYKIGTNTACIALGYKIMNRGEGFDNNRSFPEVILHQQSVVIKIIAPCDTDLIVKVGVMNGQKSTQVKNTVAFIIGNA